MNVDLDGLLRRLHLPTVRRLYRDLEVRAEAEGMGYRDFLATLIAEEVGHRAQTRIERATRRAHFPFLATIEEFDFTFQTSVRLALLGSYLGPELVSEGRSAIFLGPSGTGKTHLAIAIGYRAIQNGFEAVFTDADHLLEILSLASQAGRLRNEIATYVHPHVLIVDELGYLAHRPDAANVLFHVVNERHLRHKPTIFTTNKPLASWGRLLHDPDLAEAILDRILERGRLIEINGRSYRTRHVNQRKAEVPSDDLEEGARLLGKKGPEFPEPTSRQRPIRRSRGTRTPIAGSYSRRCSKGCTPMALRTTWSTTSSPRRVLPSSDARSCSGAHSAMRSTRPWPCTEAARRSTAAAARTPSATVCFPHRFARRWEAKCGTIGTRCSTS